MMRAFLYGIQLQWKLSLRNKEILLTYYVVPLIFYLFIGGIFTAIIPDAHKTLIQSMTVFSTTMGGLLGAPAPLVEFYGGEIKKSYRAGQVPLWTMAAGNFISAFLHLLLVSFIIFFTAPLLFDAAVPADLSSFFLSLMLLIATSLSVGTVFGLFVKHTSKLGMATQLVFLPSIMLSGIMFSAKLLPQALQTAGKLLPATWGYEAMCQGGIETMIPLYILLSIMLVIILIQLKRMAQDSF